jgi:hypothetical protein
MFARHHSDNFSWSQLVNISRKGLFANANWHPKVVQRSKFLVVSKKGLILR